MNRPAGKFCSMRCYGDFQHKQYVDKNKIQCVGCGNVFVKPIGCTGRNKAPRKYCTWACMRVNWSKVHSNGGMSSGESKLLAAIKSTGVYVRNNVNPLKFFTRVDALIPSKKICVYVDGEYWHRKSKRKDQKQNRVLKAAGFKVVRIPSKSVTKMDELEIINTIFGGKNGSRQAR